jgi:hypothetical protein
MHTRSRDDVIKRRASDEEGGGQVDFPLSLSRRIQSDAPLFSSATGALFTPSRRVTRAVFLRHTLFPINKTAAFVNHQCHTSTL